MTLVAFGMPVVALAFMGALVYGIARYNRPPARPKAGAYYVEASEVRWHFQDGLPHNP